MAANFNIAERLRETASRYPSQRAVVFPAGRDKHGRIAYTQLTFRQLDQETDRLARGLQQMGVDPGHRLVLMVRPGLEFIALAFALFKTGAVVVLIDPGMGRANIFRCLQVVNPDGFVAIPLVHAARLLSARRFPKSRFHVSVGPRYWPGMTYRKLLGDEWSPFESVHRRAEDPAAVIFTSGSTGSPKGVSYEHGMFNVQIDLLRDFYGIEPGEVDLASFPLFALFNSGMGVTTVIPEMDATRPSQADPAKIVQAIHDQGATQAFGSPALWNRVGRYCEERGIRLPTIKRMFSAGAPVPIHVLERMRKTLVGDQADIHTPYGATESLPVSSISGREVLTRTAARTREGAGTCVGRIFPQLRVKVIELSDGPLDALSDAVELPAGQPGEIIVAGPSVTREYFGNPRANRMAKIADGDRFWHRLGDVGYFDEDGSLWFCGRKAHIVETPAGRLFTIPCEAVFNAHPRVYRSALVGVGTKPRQRPVIVVEPEAGEFPKRRPDRERFTRELLHLAAANPLTAGVDTVLFHPSLPVDSRHNVKIHREQLAVWAASQFNRNRPAAGRPQTAAAVDVGQRGIQTGSSLSEVSGS